MGDFNTQIGQRQVGEEIVMESYNYRTRNERGEYLLNFCHQHNIKIINSFFKKRSGKMWTWMSPNEVVKNQIGYLISNKSKKYFKDCGVEEFKFHSDHRLVLGKLNIHLRSINNIAKKPLTKSLIE